MALFHTTVVDNQIKALDTIGTSSGSVATFDTDRAERLINLEVAITATQSGSGTPSPSNPRSINGWSNCNLSVNGTTETIPFGQTVYGGRLNVGSGVLTIDKKLAVFNGSESWEAFGSKGFTTNLSDMKTVDAYEEGLVNWLPFTRSSSIFGILLGSNNKIIYCMQMVGNVTGVTNLASWKSYLSNNNLEFTYPLATNIVLQLDSKQIQTIIGTNNIYADTGDIIDLKFVLSVGKAIS